MPHRIPLRRAPDRGLRVVAVGGGTGLAALLSGLKHRVGREIAELAAVVAVTDDGGSSGRLRREMEMPPPGDVRNCLAAVAEDEGLLISLLQYRFGGEGELGGHSFGNLFLAALTDLTGDFAHAVAIAERILQVRGRILPAATGNLTLRGLTRSGRVLHGESAIGSAGEPLERIELEPSDPPAFAEAVAAIRRADLVVLGPGSFYTSVLPNLLIPGIGAAVRATRAPVVWILNLMTQPGETTGMSGAEHLEAFERHLGSGLVDVVLAHGRPIPRSRRARYRAEGAEPIAIDRGELRRRGIALRTADLLAPSGLVRHDSRRLTAALLAVARESRNR